MEAERVMCSYITQSLLQHYEGSEINKPHIQFNASICIAHFLKDMNSKQIYKTKICFSFTITLIINY